MPNETPPRHLLHQPRWRGPIEGILQLGPAMAELGVDVEIASSDPPDAPWLASSAVPIHALGPSNLAYS